jgi:hypothetical protein
MAELARICSHCRTARLEPDSAQQAWCKVCGGSGYELTEAGSELRSFVLALLLDPKVKDSCVEFVLGVMRGVNDLR